MSRYALFVLLLAACGNTADPVAPPPEPATPSAPEAPPAATTPPPTTPAPPAPAASYFPPATGTWETVDAASAGFDQAKLDELAAFVEASHSTTFMVLYDGRILVEKYWNGATADTLQDVASAQKSVLSMLMGAVMDKGLVSFDDTVTSILGAGWSNASAEQEAPITVRHIMTMTSGLDSSLGYAAAPGSTWLYNTDAYHRNGLVLVAKTGQSLDDYTRATLFDPIGASASKWGKRPVGTDSKGLHVDALEMNARDMARVGLLIMHGGTWQDKVLVPSAYLTEATTPSQTFNPSYGLLFWLNGQASALLPPALPHPGMLMPNAPPDLVAALGADDQKIHVSRSSKIVVVRQGTSAGDPASAATTFDDEIWQHLDAAKLP